MAKLKPLVPQLPNLKKDYITPLDKNASTYEEPIKPLNRGNELASSMNQADADNLSVGLETIDEAVKYYFENKIRPSVIMNGERINVPIMYATPESWDSIQKNGMYRDKNGRILSPLIVFKRGSLDIDKSKGNKLDGNMIHNFHLFKTKYNRKNQYTPFGRIGNVSENEEYKLIAVPDYVTVSYNCVLITDYIEQNNKIIEDINFVSDAYWGEPNKFNFKANIQNYQQAIDISLGDDRVVKTSFTLIINGYLINNNLVRQMAGAKRFYSKSTISFGLEIGTTDKESIYMRSGNIPKTIKPGPATGGGSGQSSSGTGVDAATITYLNTNIQKTGTYTSSNTVTFTSTGILTAPSGLPPTTIDNFSFFVNGIYVPKTAIESFSQVGSTCVLVVNTTILDYQFKSNYEFTAVGKFS
jgi:hypothetical protein